MPDQLSILNFIDGKYVRPTSNQWLDNVNPADGQVWGLFSLGSQQYRLDNLTNAGRSLGVIGDGTSDGGAFLTDPSDPSQFWTFARLGPR